jgi:xanthine dehydrogenase accessory factor
MKELLQVLDALEAAPSRKWALATLVTAEGSSYRRPGARLLVTADGLRVGSISGGCLEDDVVLRAQEVLADGRARTIVYDTTAEDDLVWGVGLGCHGVVHLLIEPLPPSPAWVRGLRDRLGRRLPTELAVVWRGTDAAPLGTGLATDLPPAMAAEAFRQVVRPPTALLVFGAGDDARPLVRMAKELGWQVTVADPRPAWATRERFPTADDTIVVPPDTVPAGLAVDADTVAVIMTHHYRYDVPLLRALWPLPLAYLGLLGPRKRAEKIIADLEADGFTATPEMRARLHAPVGLDLGAEAPEEVALAILAEMAAIRSARDARPLRERAKPIHG